MNAEEFGTPDWARDAVFYHIFVDRFANGDTSNDGSDSQAWGATPNLTDAQGGDLAGILKRFQYMKALGVNALYLSPFSRRASYHGYDTIDYHRVEPRLGTADLLKQIVSRAHAEKWHVILDAVLNHTSWDFHAFRDLREKGEQSAFRNWYYPEGFPIQAQDGKPNYQTWNGNANLPKLNADNPETRDYLLDVGARWIKNAKIDGWRLDVPNEINHDFWKAFRQIVRAANPEAYLVGEIWEDARDWLQGDQFDSVMNYRWRDAVIDFLAYEKISPEECEARLAQIRNDYPAPATNVMFNLLGTHDTERLRTVCGGDTYRERQCVLLQLTYPGTPCIFYGDEIGLEGGKDPDNRRAMEWNAEKRDENLRAFYKHLLKVRRDHIALRRGDYQTVLVDNDRSVLAFARRHESEQVLIAVNRSRQPQNVTLSASQAGGAAWNEWLDSGASLTTEGANLCLSLPPQGMALFGTTML